MNKFADRLREIQRSRNMTQAELAKLIEISPGTLSAYLREGEKQKVPTLDTLERIAEKLGVSIGWLCGEDAGTAQVRTYADLFRILVRVISVPFEPGFPTIVDPERGMTSVVFHDPMTRQFLESYGKVYDLLRDGTIDEEMHDAWVEKKLRDFEKYDL